MPTKSQSEAPRDGEHAVAQLNELKAAVNTAAERYKSARERAAQPWVPVREVVAPLSVYHAAVLHKQRERDPAEERRLTVELLDAIRERELLIIPADPLRPALGIRIADPSLARDEERTRDALRGAKQAQDAFAREHAELIHEHEDKQKVKHVQDALSGGNPSELAAALRHLDDELPKRRPNALRTDDLSPAGVR